MEDIRRINDLAMRATPRKTGMIILGGGAAPGYGSGCGAVVWFGRNGTCNAKVS